MMANAKEVILSSALELFNTQGSRVVTTNHIAKACGISPGNLYYHFKNKEEIIRALYEQMGEEWDAGVGVFARLDMSAFGSISAISEAMFLKYRFIHTELYALCQNDPELDILNRERLQRRKAETQAMIQKLIVHEGFEELSEAEMGFLVDAIWMFVMFWLPYQDLVSNGVKAENLDVLSVLFGRFLKPKG